MKGFSRRMLFGALLAMTAVPAAHAKDGNRPRVGRIEGSITALDTSSDPQTVTIERNDRRGESERHGGGPGGPSQPASITLNLTDATRVFVGVTAGTVDDLAVGSRATAAYDPATSNALVIFVAPPKTQKVAVGKVLSADAAQATLDTNNDGTTDLTLVLNADTEVSVGGFRLGADQAGFLVGLTAEAKYDSTSFVAKSLRARLGEGSLFRGSVTAVDAAAGTLDVQNDTAMKSFTVADGAEVRRLGRRVELGDLEVGDPVAVLFVSDGTDNLALRVEVLLRPKHVSGILTDVGDTDVTITPRGRDTTPVVLAVDDATKLRLNGRKATLADVAAALAALREGKAAKAEAVYLAGGTNHALIVNVEARVRRGGRH